ncbi:Mediator of RNA polymerase II transcription subunit 6 [Collariella sp. IMI 366227]|nr:Mediator of RNA polymerase II transcription subunit 6 [Collariella sp. IMI 366227]
MTFDPAAHTGPPLDEIQWRAPPEFEAGVHNNSVLYYFAQSPFYDKTSNNEVVFQQGLNNPNMTQFLATRELFEGRLKTMSGLEFIVAQEPAETGPGMGTGVWVINKQTRRKRQGEEDEIMVHATYFIVGENIYMAPSLADLISSRIVQSLGIQQSFGEHHMNSNPITGKPGDFHLSSTGRKLAATNPANNNKPGGLVPALPTLNTRLGGAAGPGNPLAMGNGTKAGGGGMGETKSPKTLGGEFGGREVEEKKK